MSRHIDFSKPLTDDELEYVNDRPWLLVDAKLRGLSVHTEEDFTIESDDEEETSPTSGTEDHEDGDSGEDESEDEDESEEDEEDEELPPYEEWSYADLKAEADSRGLSKNGSKEQLVERLTESDSAAE